MLTRNNRLCSLLVSVFALTSLAASAQASPITGRHLGWGKMREPMHMPFEFAGRGMFGMRDRSGWNNDDSGPGWSNFTRQSSISFDWSFDISDQLQGVTQLDPEQLNLQFTVSGLNFNPTKGRAETLGLSFLTEAGENAPSLPDLLIDSSNYGDYRPDGFGATDKTQVTYNINLGRDLGLTADEVANLLADGTFAMHVTLTGTAVHCGWGPNFMKQAREMLDSGNVNFQVMPEPVTLGFWPPEPSPC